MPIDLFGSLRSTAVVALVGASFASPIVMQSDVLGKVGSGLGLGASDAHAEVDRVEAGEISFAMQEGWTRMGSAHLDGTEEHAGTSVGQLVDGVCPGGRAPTGCADGVSVSFVTYDGEGRSSIPALGDELEQQLKRGLGTRMASFRMVGSETRTMDDGGRYLHVIFTWTERGAERIETVGVYRRTDGSGTIVVADGPTRGMMRHSAGIDSFLGSAHDAG